jgi:DNA-binding beta-propeller fold protein YncE
VVDLETLEVCRIVTHETIQVHYAVNLFPDGERMFLYNYDGSIVVLENAADPQKVRVETALRINQPALPDASVGGKGYFTADGLRYINPNWHANNIFALDLANQYAHSVVVTGAFDKPDDLVMTPGERKGYTASHGAGGARGALHAFDLETGQITKAIQVGRKPAGLSMSPDSRIVYVTNVPDGSISAVDTLTDEVCFTASAAELYRKAGITGDHLDIEGVTVSADGKTLYAYAVNYGALVVFEDLGGENRARFWL